MAKNFAKIIHFFCWREPVKMRQLFQGRRIGECHVKGHNKSVRTLQNVLKKLKTFGRANYLC